ncbi:MAG TPA: outer membrane protein assembly factor BamB [Xanthomonadaceae bacterium]|nr:outer membrane protein assembly factor BamB [Xanthomonadaceae bacterium]
MDRTRFRLPMPALAAALALATLTLGGCNLFKSPTRENVEPPAELTEFAPTRTIERLWTQRMGKGEKRLGLRRSIGVSAGRVLAATLEGEAVALDAATGRTLWLTETGLRLSSTPGAGEGTVVIGALDGEVIALDEGTGNERWRAKVSSEVVAAPAVDRGLAVVRANDGRMFGFDLASGERRWVFDRGLPTLTLRGNGPPLARGGAVFAGYDDGTVVALRIDDGALVWEAMVAEPSGRTDLDRMVDVDGQLEMAGAELFAAAYGGQVMGLAAENGSQRWAREMSAYGGLALAGDRLVVADAAGTVWALSLTDGSALWKQDALAWRWLSSPAVLDGTVVVGDFEGYLHWFDLESGRPAARTRMGKNPIRARPVAAGGIVYAVNTNGEIGAYRAGGG